MQRNANTQNVTMCERKIYTVNPPVTRYSYNAFFVQQRNDLKNGNTDRLFSILSAFRRAFISLFIIFYYHKIKLLSKTKLKIWKVKRI